MSGNLAPPAREIAGSRKFCIRTTKKVCWSKNVLIHQNEKHKSQGQRREDASFPEVREISSRNLKYMRAFVLAWPEHQIVQEALAQITLVTKCFKELGA